MPQNQQSQRSRSLPASNERGTHTGENTVPWGVWLDTRSYVIEARAQLPSWHPDDCRCVACCRYSAAYGRANSEYRDYLAQLEARRFCPSCKGRAEHRAMCPTVSGPNWTGHRTFAGADRYFECERCGRSWPSRLLDDYGFCPDCLKRIAEEPFDPDRPF